MNGLARVGDLVQGGVHCHGGHDHPPPATPGRIVSGSPKVFVRGRAAARAGDEGHSDLCCVGLGRIVLEAAQAKVYIDGRAAVARGAPSKHCTCATGWVATGDMSVRIP
jgi:uncharacterized Zn-binding protein involved in type VI secretion